MEQNSVNNQESVDRIIESLLGDNKVRDFIEIDLPSKGIGYTFTDGAKKLKIRPMTFVDEKAILSSKKGDGGNPVSVLLSRCILNLDPSELYIFDKLYVLLKIREESYGETYNGSIPCPNCSKENDLSIKINALMVNDVEDGFGPIIEVKLKKIGKVAKVRVPRVKDEKLLGTFDKAAGNLWRFIESVDIHTDPVVIAKLIERLPINDANALIKSILNPSYGVVPSIRMECIECQSISTIALPISSDFFIGS